MRPYGSDYRIGVAVGFEFVYPDEHEYENGRPKRHPPPR
jgi:hypothetical protein